MRILYLASLAVLFCSAASPAFAQDPSKTTTELCKKAPEAERAECTTAVSQLEAALTPDQWMRFFDCANTKDLTKDKGNEIVSCISPDMLQRILEVQQAKAQGQPIPQPTSTPPSTYVPPTAPANGVAFSPDEFCASVPANERAKCVTEANQLKTMLGDKMWAEFAACGVKIDFSSGNMEGAMKCISPEMMSHIQIEMEKQISEEMRKAEEAQKKMEEEMKKLEEAKKSQQPPPP